MQVSNLTLAYLLSEITPKISGGFVNKVQEIGRGIFKLKIHSKEGSMGLIVTDSALFLSAYSFPARQNSSSFFTKLRRLLSNKKIVSISQHELDRVVVIEFSDYFLFLEFFHKSNVVLTDKNKKIVLLLHSDDSAERPLKKGLDYLLPKAAGKNPQKATAESLLERFAKSSRTVLEEIVSGVNTSALIAKEILFRAKIAQNSPAGKITKAQAEKIAETLKRIYSMQAPSKEAVVVGQELLPFPFESVQGTPAKSLFDALGDHYAGSAIQKPAMEGIAQRQSEASRLKFSMLAQQESREKLVASAEENQKRGEFIYGHFVVLQEIAKAVNVAQKKKLNEKEVMYKINSALSQKAIRGIVKVAIVDFRKKEIELEAKTG